MELTAEKILSAKKVGELFTNDKNIMKSEYVALSKKWHPDCNGNSEESNKVMTKINLFYNKAIDLFENNLWEGKKFIQLYLNNYQTLPINYNANYDFELGTYFTCNDKIIYVIEKEHEKFFINYKNSLAKLKFANDSMKKEFGRYLPFDVKYFKTNDEKFIISIKKPDGFILLRDILNFYNGKIPDRHVAWILSTLYNIVCFLYYNNISQNGINLDNYFISPSNHSGALLGGWWYCTEFNKKMIGMPKEIYNILPPNIKSDKMGNIISDLESVRLIGRQLLGERSSYNIKLRKDIPEPFVNWLLLGSNNNAIEEYERWGKILTDSYGKRHFVEMKISENNLYN
jgi:hypothetical protein